MMAANNRPLTMRFDNRLTRRPVRVYSWHVSPDGAGGRIGRWPTVFARGIAAATAAAKIQLLQTAPQVVAEMTSAMGAELLWVLAGDLNVQQRDLTSGAPTGMLPPFPKGYGFRIASGGGTGLDHIVALYGRQAKLRVVHMGGPLGDHAPLGGIITL
jgi:hypothetical protein